MDTMRLVFSLLVVSFTVSSVHALEWVEYEGTIPENAVSVNEGTEDRPVCRKNSRIGIVNDAGKCYSVKVGGGVSKKTEDDGYQILVDNSETEIELAVAAATEGTYTQAEYDAAANCEISFEWDWREFEDRAGVTVYNDGGIPFYTIDGNVSNLDGDYLPLLRVNGEQWGFQVSKGGNTTRYWQIRMRPPTIGTCKSYSKYGCEY